MLQRQLSHLNGLELTTGEFKRLIFFVSGFTFSNTAIIFVLMIPYAFCLFPIQFYYIIIYWRKVETRVQIMDQCAPWKFSNGAAFWGCSSFNSCFSFLPYNPLARTNRKQLLFSSSRFRGNVFCLRMHYPSAAAYTGCFTTLEHNFRRWYPMSLWSKKFI
jgi:hypothetical protein